MMNPEHPNRTAGISFALLLALITICAASIVPDFPAELMIN